MITASSALKTLNVMHAPTPIDVLISWFGVIPTVNRTGASSEGWVELPTLAIPSLTWHNLKDGGVMIGSNLPAFTGITPNMWYNIWIIQWLVLSLFGTVVLTTIAIAAAVSVLLRLTSSLQSPAKHEMKRGVSENNLQVDLPELQPQAIQPRLKVIDSSSVSCCIEHA